MADLVSVFVVKLPVFCLFSVCYLNGVRPLLNEIFTYLIILICT